MSVSTSLYLKKCVISPQDLRTRTNQGHEATREKHGGDVFDSLSKEETKKEDTVS